MLQTHGSNAPDVKSLFKMFIPSLDYENVVLFDMTGYVPDKTIIEAPDNGLFLLRSRSSYGFSLVPVMEDGSPMVLTIPNSGGSQFTAIFAAQSGTAAYGCATIPVAKGDKFYYHGETITATIRKNILLAFFPYK